MTLPFVKAIQGTKHSLDVAIYDTKNPDALEALKAMYTKVQLHILYDAGKARANSTTVDPKSSTSAAIKAAASVQQRYSATFLLTDNPPLFAFSVLLLIINIFVGMFQIKCGGVQ